MDTDNLENIENEPAKLDKALASLSLKDFNRIIDEIAKDDTISDVEKIIVAKDLHRIAHRDFSYEAVGKILGISKVGAFKVEQRALKKLRKQVEKAGISAEDFRDLMSKNA